MLTEDQKQQKGKVGVAFNRARWSLFKAISWVGWRVCPEPQRSNVWASWKENTIGG